MYFKLSYEPDSIHSNEFCHYCSYESLPWNETHIKFVMDSKDRGALARSIQETYYIPKSDSDLLIKWSSLIKALSPPSKNKGTLEARFACFCNEDGCEIRVYPEKYNEGDTLPSEIKKDPGRFVYGGHRLEIAMTRTPLVSDLDSSKEECMKFLKWIVKKSKT
jgi:hypothetical protein